jgi:hypothetical protein
MIYVFDLDNTLCITVKKDNGDWDYLSAIPIQDRIKKVNNIFEEGNKIIIETARGCNSKKNWYIETFEQIRSWGLRFHELRTGVKFGADFYVDDKAINSEFFFKE